MKKLKIAYVTTYDGRNVNNWSGLSYYIANTLQKYIGEVYFIGNLNKKTFLINTLKRGFAKIIEGKSFHIDRTKEIGIYYAEQVKNQIKNNKYDIIFSPGTIPIAYLETNLPKIFWADANFNVMLNYYFHNLSSISINDGNKMEQTALNSSALAIYSSKWAASSAINYYNVDSNKVKVIPFGANINNVPELSQLEHPISGSVKLLFVGKDWERKGGIVAYQTLQELKNFGIKSHLTIVGCIPPKEINDKDLTIIPFLDKNKIEDAKLLNKLFLESNFFLMPSKQECYGVVFCEAAAFGLPVLATLTGGIPTIVKEGVNGYLLPVETRGIDFANKIIEILNNKNYESLCLSSRKRYDELLNWDTAGRLLKKEIEKII